MQASAKTFPQDQEFWAYIHSISETVGYQPHGESIVKEYTQEDLKQTIQKNNLNPKPIFGGILTDSLTERGRLLLKYLNYRSKQVKKAVNNLRIRDEAITEFNEYVDYQSPTTIHRNKQGNDEPLVFTNTVNAVIEKEYGGKYNFDPQQSAKITDDENRLKMSFIKRLDGAVPDNKNPHSMWEIKEFYNSTTFGSRISAIIYEIMLIKQQQLLSDNDETAIYLLTDGYEGWKNGISYICRIIDILNRGFIDAAIFGEEVLTEWVDIVSTWEN